MVSIKHNKIKYRSEFINNHTTQFIIFYLNFIKWTKMYLILFKIIKLTLQIRAGYYTNGVEVLDLLYSTRNKITL